MSTKNVNLPIVYSCSGCSSVAQMANYIALELDKLGLAEMSCIAGVGGRGLRQAPLKRVVDARHFVPVTGVAVHIKPAHRLDPFGRTRRGAGRQRQHRHQRGSSRDQRPGRMAKGWAVNAHGSSPGLGRSVDLQRTPRVLAMALVLGEAAVAQRAAVASVSECRQRFLFAL